MGAGHSHATAGGTHRNRLWAALAITLTVLVAEVIGGILSGSLALLADAGHMLTDAVGVGAALLATYLAARAPTPDRTFGLQRAEILAAFANCLLLFGVSVYILIEAVQRWSDPPTVSSGLMLIVAVIGAAANVVSLLILRGGQSESLNVRGAYLEVLGDLLGSFAVIVAAIVISTTGYARADALASVLIALMILPRAWSLLRDVVDVLLEATPKDVDMAEVRAHIKGVDGVADVHDLHAWTITSGVPVLSAHIVLEDDYLTDGRSGMVLDELGKCLGEHFDVEHCTFQLEASGHRDHEAAHHA